MNWLKNNWPLLVLIGGAVLVGHYMFPKEVTHDRVIPQIITKTDTVQRVPNWLADSIKKWKVRKVTTDTFNLVVERTVIQHDTILDSLALWPVLTFFRDAKSRADTAFVRTWRHGVGVVSRVYSPGPVVAILADTSPTPRIQFGEWPHVQTSKWTKLMWAGIGFGACAVTGRVH